MSEITNMRNGNCNNKLGIDNIPITGLHMGKEREHLLYHPRAEIVENRWLVRKKAYEEQLRKVRETNTKIWEESVTKLPAELYSRYSVAKGIEHFRRLTTNTAPLKVRDPITGNIFWAYDLAQVVLGLRRMVEIGTLESVVEVDEAFVPTWKQQLKQFTNVRRKASTKIYSPQDSEHVVEQYDNHMRLMYVFPNVAAAAEFNRTLSNNIVDAIKRNRMCNNCWFRYFYDNKFVALSSCVIEQLYKGESINRFTSIKEASEIMEIPTYTIYRLLRNPTTEDKYECTWRKLPKN